MLDIYLDSSESCEARNVSFLQLDGSWSYGSIRSLIGSPSTPMYCTTRDPNIKEYIVTEQDLVPSDVPSKANAPYTTTVRLNRVTARAEETHSKKPKLVVPTPTTAQEISFAGLGPTGTWFQVVDLAEAWPEMFLAELINVRMCKVLQPTKNTQGSVLQVSWGTRSRERHNYNKTPPRSLTSFVIRSESSRRCFLANRSTAWHISRLCSTSRTRLPD